MKTCTTCGETKSKELFEKGRNQCKACLRAQRTKWQKENPEKEKIRKAKWYKENSKKVKAASAKYRKENPEKAKAEVAEWRKENPEKLRIGMRKYQNDRLKNDLNFRLRKNLRVRINMALKNSCKSESTLELLGCTVDFLKDHLQSKFSEGMTLENYGTWHIDHIKPCALFDLTDVEQQKQCFHYSNLQPLWGVDNLKKGAKYDILSAEP